MTTKFTKTFVAAFAAAVIGVSALAAPAMAAGQVSVSYTPTDPDEAQALGLEVRAPGVIDGLGERRAAGVDRTGEGGCALRGRGRGGAGGGRGAVGVVVGTASGDSEGEDGGSAERGERTSAHVVSLIAQNVTPRRLAALAAHPVTRPWS